MPRLLLIDDVASRRLLAVSALASRFEVISAMDDEDPLRVARTSRPDVALIAVHRRNPDASLRLCRTLRTDVRPIRPIGLYDGNRRPQPAEQVTRAWLADGYLVGEVTGPDLVEFVDALLRGEQPVRSLGAPPSALGRLVRRLTR
jgi:CheY-like chemotaxis protein